MIPSSRPLRRGRDHAAWQYVRTLPSDAKVHADVDADEPSRTEVPPGPARDPQQWRGTTPGGRTLVLSGTGALLTGTLDGQPISITKVQGLRTAEGEARIVRSDAGTFTAIAPGSSSDLHARMLTASVEARPEGGWAIGLIRSEPVAGDHHFAFSVSNGWRSAVLELRLSPQVVEVWGRAGGASTLQDLATRALQRALRSSDWSGVQRYADRGPTRISALASSTPPEA